MSSKPPLLPAEIVARMLRVARFDGGSVLVLCGALAVASAWYGDFTGALVGVLIAGAGAFELHGAGLVKAGEPRGLNWLIASQLYLLAAILSYVGWRLLSYDPVAVRHLLEPMLRASDLQAQLAEAGATEADLLAMVRTLYFACFGLVALATLFYQGGMALYYHRRRAAVAAVLYQHI
ncbi:MAG TPA: hypothetical protein VMC06_00890 [Opitutaceae bacterium]|nr:hypothetical protein [Opitutaceae bacterium]